MRIWKKIIRVEIGARDIVKSKGQSGTIMVETLGAVNPKLGEIPGTGLSVLKGNVKDS